MNSILIDINDCLVVEYGENDEIVGSLNLLCREEEEIDFNPSEECLEE